ncbi:nucleotidyltransferase family protein [Bacteroides helcogenes]|uniref:Nucleotidyl transferase n=1 Tax=Bacteroides helcogenes (strain ATCC 35417 / DSM 20613 / JCM 6297 / CCUG 15421 / P 36-108) TaxID=693979 RepID=E6SSW9_BACT6|nr:nucleotidyltransferase family protein [Bacteroides helcogenes]ADV44200.1 Nucleotidyl transferase [Bacteroides helcogenes P 36-108]MDY5238386.1 nucleotidyltransferase family protein [Bacteroides helcogenes]
MKAMIFAAGLGTRLRPLTDNMPKALVPVAGKPMLERVLLRLKEAGFGDIVINIHHFGEQIIDFLHANDNFGMNISISDERDMLLDTGGGIRKARPFLDGDEPFLVHNSDILTDMDLSAFYQQHLENNAEATLLVSERKTSRYLLFDDSYNLHGWINKSTGEVKPEKFSYREGKYKELAFGGIHVISPSLFRNMDNNPWKGKFSIISFYLSVCRTARIQGYPLQDFRWFDIGKPETLSQAEKFWH